MNGIGERVFALRRHLGLKQLDVSERSGVLSRVDMSMIERGHNLATSFRVREGLARGFGLPFDVMVSYLGGDLSLEDVAQQVASGPAPRAALDKGKGGDHEAVDPVGRLPNLRLAVRLVAEDLRFDPGVVRKLARRLALDDAAAGNRTTLEWATLVKAEAAKLTTEVQLNPFRIKNLRQAVVLLSKEHPGQAALIEQLAARVASEEASPRGLSTVRWIELLQQALRAADPQRRERVHKR